MFVYWTFAYLLCKINVQVGCPSSFYGFWMFFLLPVSVCHSQCASVWSVAARMLLMAKFRFKLKKVGHTTRPFMYDLNQIPYDYTVEVRNRFKGLDLIESLMNYGRRFVALYRRQGSRPSPWKRNAKKQNGCLKMPYKQL